jgi:hypothetical protein
MTNIEFEIKNRLTKTFSLLIQHALQHALDTDENDSNLLQIIINIQSALELLFKIRSLSEKGWTSIVPEKFWARSENSILNDLKNENLRTVQYEDLLVKFDEYYVLDEAVRRHS